MSKQKDYTSYPFVIAIIVIAMVSALYFIPGKSLGNFTFKRVNIISDIMNTEPEELLAVSDEQVIDTSLIVENISSISPSSIKKVQSSLPDLKTENWTISTNSASLMEQGAERVEAAKSEKEVLESAQKIVAIEDFSSQGQMNIFYGQLAHKERSRPLRIAMLGDSFIEGDIVTADIREQLQTLYGGHGVGFVPLTSDVLKFRATVKHSSAGWEVANLLNRKSAPLHLRDKFSISGVVCTPSDGAFARFEGVGFRKKIRRFATARLLFINEQNTVVTMTINDTVNRIFTPESSPYIQQISVAGDIASVKVTVSNPDGFIGYGVVLEDRDGVSVDNYSIRGNSGMSLVATSSAINSQINKAIGFDLIMLQYGLNAMSANVTSYDSYSRQMCKIIDYIKGCFPGSAIVVMGVGDRGTQVDGQFVTMKSVQAMIKAQREAARKSEVAFWSIFDAMGGEGSMVEFVRKNWAAKDYTHISYVGGRYIASQFVKALVSGKDGAASVQNELSVDTTLPSYQTVPTIKNIE